MTRVLSRVAVIIFAVVERPGLSSSLGLSRVTTTLKSLASSWPLVDWLVATAGAQQRLIADFSYMALEDPAGNRVDRYVGFLSERDIDDVGFVHLDLGGNDRDIGEGHED